MNIREKALSDFKIKTKDSSQQEKGLYKVSIENGEYILETDVFLFYHFEEGIQHCGLLFAERPQHIGGRRIMYRPPDPYPQTEEILSSDSLLYVLQSVVAFCAASQLELRTSRGKLHVIMHHKDLIVFQFEEAFHLTCRRAGKIHQRKRFEYGQRTFLCI